MIDPTAEIHRLAHVERAVIGARTRVWQFASVIRNAKIGEDCKIASCAIVDGATIGDRTIVSHGAFLDPGMCIGSDVFIGPYVIFCNDFWPRVSKEDFDMESLLSGEVVTTIVEGGASIGAGAIILPGVTIGERAMIAAGAVVDRDVLADRLFRRDGNVDKIVAQRPVRRVRAVRGRMPLEA